MTTDQGTGFRVQRIGNGPIIRPGMDDRMGSNINGSSVIRVPDWVRDPLGRFYLYFAHHQGTYIRLAYAARIEGPWTVYSPGVLDLADSFFDRHIASPDVHVDDDAREIRMYFHGCCLPEPPHQFTRLATSDDGLEYHVRPEILGSSYWRVFEWEGRFYTLEMPGRFRRSRDGMTGFEAGPLLFTPGMRHAAVLLRGHTLYVFYSNAGDCPERILLSTIDLRLDWMSWRAADPVDFLVPETEYEGADLASEPSERGSVHARARQLRDPCIFLDGGRTCLFYSVAGESGIALAELIGE